MIPGALEFKLQWEVDWRLSGEQRLPMVMLHVLSGWLLLMILGALWQVHLRAGWRQRKNHLSGITLALCLCVLAVTGIGLYYLGSELGQTISSVTHSGTGILFGLIIGWHIWHGGQIRMDKRRKQSVRLNSLQPGLVAKTDAA